MNDLPVCQVQLKHQDGDRCIQIALSLLEETEQQRLLVYASHFHCQMEGLDEPAAGYFLENWESGILSGAFFAFRKLKRPLSRLLISELHGRLRSEDMETLAYAVAVGIACLLDEKMTWPCPSQWQCSQKRFSSHAEVVELHH